MIKNRFLSIFSVFAVFFLLPSNVVLGGEIQKSFRMGKDRSIHFYVNMPKGAGKYSWSARGRGKATIAVKRCGPASAKNHNHVSWLYKLSEAYTNTSGAPAHETGCRYGVFVKCVQGACEGRIRFAIGGVASENPKVSPYGTSVGSKPGKPKIIVVPGGDAGSQNASAARIPYNCRVVGALARGDYDFFTFNHPGGKFRAHSERGLNLVADLIRAADGKMLARSGVATPQFRFGGDLAAGRYILAIRVMRHAAEGPYRVDLGTPGGCTVKETAN